MTTADPDGMEPHETGARLAAAYAGRVGTMRDIGLAHDGLEVAAIGFRAEGGHVTGIVLTPWFMNLVRVAGVEPLPDATEGGTVSYSYPAGAIDFTVGHAPGFGRMDAVSLFSPMFEFEDQAAALATAEATLDELFRAAEPAPPLAAPRPSEPAPSRRGLLFGRGGDAR
jgi:[NiFe] hydrogenase assembly HybE family chaperone